MALRKRVGLGGLCLLGGAALAISFVAKPLVPAALATDSDSDGLSNTFESAFGTNPNAADTDGDGWTDWFEIFVKGTDPTDNDTDGDAIGDATDPDPLDDFTVGGGSADGRTTPTSTWSSNLSAPALTGESAIDGRDVYMQSGEFFHTVTPLVIHPGYGPAIDVSWTYRSGISFDGIAGQNGVFAFMERVSEQPDGSVHLYWGSGPLAGRRSTFASPGGGLPRVYTSPADGIYWKLTKQLSGAFVLRHSHGDERNFDSSGRLVSLKDRFGNTTTLTYSGSQLTTITDAVGHTVTIDYYSSTGRVKSLTDGNSREVLLTYNYFGQLAKWRSPISTAYPAGRVSKFIYSNGSSSGTLNDNMVYVIDPKGQAWIRNEFDSSDRIVTQYLGSDPFTFSYAAGVVTVFDREGNKREWKAIGSGVTELVHYSNRDVRAGDPASWTTEVTHSSAHLPVKVVWPRGNRMDLTYDSAGNVIVRRRRSTDTDSNAPDDLVDTYEYDAAYNLMTSHTDPNGNTTTFTLEDSGALEDKVVETITHPTVTYLSPDQTATETFTWNSQGQLCSVESPQAGAPVSRFDLHGRGREAHAAHDEVGSFPRSGGSRRRRAGVAPVLQSLLAQGVHPAPALRDPRAEAVLQDGLPRDRADARGVVGPPGGPRPPAGPSLLDALLRGAAAPKGGAFDRLLDAVFARARARGLIGAPADGSVDATGFETRHISVHFVRRRGMRPHWRCRWPKLTICGLNDSHLIAAATVTKGPTNDSPELPPLVRQAARRVELAGVLADAAFDAEHHHRLCREELGIPFTAIPVNPRGFTGPPRGGPYRRRLARRFPRRRYAQRWQVESIFSRHKRRLGSALTARSDAARSRELLLRALTHNLMILRLPVRVSTEQAS